MRSSWPWLGLALVAVAATIILASGDGETEPATGMQEPQACTLVGCASGVGVYVRPLKVEFPEAREVSVCVDSECQSERMPVDAVEVENASAAEGRASVTVELSDRTGRSIYSDSIGIRLTVSQPNGPRCEPTCVLGGVAVDPETLDLRRYDITDPSPLPR